MWKQENPDSSEKTVGDGIVPTDDLRAFGVRPDDPMDDFEGMDDEEGAEEEMPGNEDSPLGGGGVPGTPPPPPAV